MGVPAFSLALGGLGKLPSQPEFIRVNANSREPSAFDQWIQEGLYFMRREYGAEWEKRYDHLLHHRFVYRADNCGQTMVGVMRAATDSHERRFPFATYYLVPTQQLDAQPMLVPTLLDGLFDPLEALIEELADNPNLVAIKKRLDTVIELPSFPANVEDRYQTFLDEVACEELGCFPGSSVDLLLSELVTTLPGAEGHPRSFQATMQLPLEQPPYARGLEIRFWIELCMLLLKWYPPTLTYFWHSGNPSPRRGTLLMTFKQPAGYLMPELVNDGTAIIKGVWRPGLHQTFPGGAAKRGQLRVGPTSSLRQLLLSINPGYPGACRWYRP